jgi:TRAP-type C4-dicarboxylate transport system substrate-binding protein
MSKRNFLRTWFVGTVIFLSCVSLMPVDATAQVKPVTLKMTVWTAAPEMNVFSQANTLLVREVEKRSGGRLKIEYYWSGTLLPAKDTVSGMQTGVADLGFVVPTYEPGKLPLSTVASLPAISHDFYPASMAAAELHEMPELKAELAQHNIMYLSYVANTSAGIWTRRPIRSLADLKGKKIASQGDAATLLRSLGAVPLNMITTEVYQAMEKGTVDGGLANPGYASDYKWWEVAPNYYELLFGNSGAIIVAINKNSWNMIPADLQKMFVDLREEICRKSHDIYQTNAETKLKKQVADKVVSHFKPSAADKDGLEKVAKEVVWMKWVDRMKERGLPGQKVLEAWQTLYKKWDDKSPFNK